MAQVQFCGLTSEVSGAQRHCAAGRRLTCTARGAMPLRVRLDRLVMHPPSPVFLAEGYRRQLPRGSISMRLGPSDRKELLATASEHTKPRTDCASERSHRA